MGLHAQIHQLDREVMISLQGPFRTPELDQLQAILAHFYGRGCRKFVLDTSRLAPISPTAQASLDRLLGQPTSNSISGSAIRLLADPPSAALPQRSCGGVSCNAA